MTLLRMASTRTGLTAFRFNPWPAVRYLTNAGCLRFPRQLLLYEVCSLVPRLVSAFTTISHCCTRPIEAQALDKGADWSLPGSSLPVAGPMLCGKIHPGHPLMSSSLFNVRSHLHSPHQVGKRVGFGRWMPGSGTNVLLVVGHKEKVVRQRTA
ncbi:hypothetical protein B0J13DRAFT_187727 [Dactylonectria estremocensis]|uniref:Uncharacterized protein n=1 Tax=Dactylonectria estremocensis TaxID=1079267 RepID=A0A9P9FCX3_9HYPO|nr:hypothetical protein B0J13DRAFT_187727 [Dactylonectria estremocensis]